MIDISTYCPRDSRYVAHSAEHRHIVLQKPTYSGAPESVFPVCTAHANDYHRVEGFEVFALPQPTSTPTSDAIRDALASAQRGNTSTYKSRGQRIAEHFGVSYEEWYRGATR